ncbi:SDR family oxidoreductase [Neorhizobium lilium]|uniref:SDR family oxidoreductase n=1 Tax=Neorhizobium lilium TaxID=2503024 RepID=A0A444LJL7_9HYPH|nr:SDR family oxidoreductase [Neorhizobium lilium]RWX79134.1 SDR family oxidoreductase [Neorhizobium lilium]
MRVFVTGATGFVGSAVVQELIRTGHQVVGLARSDASAAALGAVGVEVVRGGLEDADSLKAGAAACDGLIHCGFNHDFSKFAENCEMDRRAIETMAGVLAGSDRPLIVTSGTGLIAPGQIADEDTLPPQTSSIPRRSEQAAMAAFATGVNASIVRLPPSVHGIGDHGFVPILIGMARDKGRVAYTGEGMNHWPAVHRFDAAKVYRLVLEKGREAAGRRFHATDEDGIPFRQIAEAIGKGLTLPVAGVSGEEAAAYYGWFSHFAAIDNRVSSRKTREFLGWQPSQPGLLQELAEPHYFQ